MSNKKKKGFLREWGDALLFAVVAATFIRWIAFEAFTIPTSSMEKSLYIGDFLFVSKLHYGPRTPKTPLQVPLTHQKIWGTDINSFSDAIQLPQFRLPGFSEVKNNDVVVFNYPAELNDYPTDLKTNYIKRCIGIAGDDIEIKEQVVYINGQKADYGDYVNLQTGYDMVTKQLLTKDALEELSIYYNIHDVAIFPSPERANYINEQYGGYVISKSSENNTYTYKNVNLTDKQVKELKKNPLVVSITKVMDIEPSPNIFGSAVNNWSTDNFGPLHIPKEGEEVKITTETWPYYKDIIQKYEENDNPQFKGGKLYIGGQATDTYTIQQNYYFMMGDNRHNSLDSRFWGFVPEDHIIGKAVMTWFSRNPNPDTGSVRWDRILHIIDSDFQLPSIIKIIILAIFFGTIFFFSKKEKANKGIDNN
ncbi:signal peptidase I [Flammeovirga sp. MY04]|uniref:signal peptidase I n=1 Tax=Flammeovirga sp. MY04 TaxID=1191459 RepID=UPI0008063E0A|nr:signal peptidase I [Flammeovirga sp. MY04]ANQ47484.1 signal peptidase I [Flammeovirga sp. MY04]